MDSYLVSYRFENAVTTGIQGSCYVLAKSTNEAKEIVKQWLLNTNTPDTEVTYPLRTLRREKPYNYVFISPDTEAPWCI